MTTVTLRYVNLMDNQWMKVADCLRGLPELAGLLLEALEVEEDKYLDSVTVMNIPNHAMGGRYNHLISDLDPILGALSRAAI